LGEKQKFVMGEERKATRASRRGGGETSGNAKWGVFAPNTKRRFRGTVGKKEKPKTWGTRDTPPNLGGENAFTKRGGEGGTLGQKWGYCGQNIFKGKKKRPL